MAKMVAAQSHQAEQSEMTSLSTKTQLEESSPDPDTAIFAIQHEMGPSMMILQGVELENDQ